MIRIPITQEKFAEILNSELVVASGGSAFRSECTEGNLIDVYFKAYPDLIFEVPQ